MNFVVLGLHNGDAIRLTTMRAVAMSPDIFKYLMAGAYALLVYGLSFVGVLDAATARSMTGGARSMTDLAA